MSHPLMPKATAVWLVENTALSFRQIADFCGIHELEIQAIADGEVAVGMQGMNPVMNGELTQEEIDRCQADPKASLKPAKSNIPEPRKKPKGARYTPVSKRQDRPDAIAWLLKNCPEMTDAQISKLIGTTKPTIKAIRDKTHWNSANLKPQNPVSLGLCSEPDLEKVVAIARAKAGTVHAAPVRELGREELVQEAPKAAEPTAEGVFGAAPEKKEEPAEEIINPDDVFKTPS